MSIIKEEAKDLRGIASRFKRKDFKGNTGQAIKNSTYQFASTLVAKVGSIFFTIIMARWVLGPEVFGFYGLALSTILFIGAFNNLGIGKTLSFFLSKNIDKNPKKAKGYFYYLTKWRIALTVLTMIIIVLLSKILATHYQKPIYLAILAGAIYLPASVLSSHISTIFVSLNNFKAIFVKEFIFQILRLTILPLTIIFVLSRTNSIEAILSIIILMLAFCYLIAGAYLCFNAIKNKVFSKKTKKNLSSKEKIDLKRFTLPLIVMSFSGTFFSFIDQIMLGLFHLSGEILGFYYISIGLISSIYVIIGVSGAAVLPILARIKGERLERGFRKSKNVTLAVSFFVFILSFIFTPLIIKILYGSQYSGAKIYFQFLSLLLISYPLINIYSVYYLVQKRTKIISAMLVLSTILNVVLNYTFISLGLKFSMSYAAIGACVATIISQYSYMLALILFRKR